jgi:putative N6-adenine-specific DNA methylase
MFLYQQNRRFFAQVATGFEPLVAKELDALGARDIQTGFRGVFFVAGPAGLYVANYESRLATRILAPLITFTCRDRDDLYRAGKSVAWHRLFSTKNTFSIAANVNGNPSLTHSKFAALCLKDAIADAFRNRYGCRPDVDRLAPEVAVNLHIAGTSATISLDTSGASLHRRGYRLESVPAPMQESLAAALIDLSEWDGKTPLYDPMCGSGTLLCEAAMRAARIPAGYLRKGFGFRFLPDFDNGLWQRTKKRINARIKPLPVGLVSGSDMAAGAVQASLLNCLSLPGGDQITLTQQNFEDIDSLENRVIVCNPPYGIRLQAGEDIGMFYKSFGDFLKQRCTGSLAYVFFGDRGMIKHIGLRPAWKKPLKNAGLDGRVVKYELY